MASPTPTHDSIHAPSEQKHVTPWTVAVDLALCAVFFAVLFGWVKTHVHSNETRFIVFFGASATLCVTGVFWMAIQMFRVVVAGEKTLKAERAGK
jgi:hypothetical protein